MSKQIWRITVFLLTLIRVTKPIEADSSEIEGGSSRFCSCDTICSPISTKNGSYWSIFIQVFLLFLFMNFSSQPSLAHQLSGLDQSRTRLLSTRILLGSGTLSILLGVFNDDVEFERNIVPKAFMSIEDFGSEIVQHQCHVRRVRITVWASGVARIFPRGGRTFF